MSEPTEIEIANMALDMLHEGPITSLTENRPAARWFARNMTPTRDALLESTDWDFARRRVMLAQDAEKPTFFWQYAYTLPLDCVRLLPVTADGSVHGRPIKHEREGRRVLCNLSGPLKVRYIRAEPISGAWPATAREALAARLATKLAHTLTGKSSYAEIAQNLYGEAIRNAHMSNAVQGTEPMPADDEWLDARHGPVTWFNWDYTN